MTLLLDHLIILPIILPLVIGAVLMVINDRRKQLKVLISEASALALLVIALALLVFVDNESIVGVSSYRLGSWPASFGIVLVIDRLAALMLVLTALVAIPSVAFATVRWQRAGPRFHTLFQLQLMGLNGAFLTGDLFNLFVFFEVLLAASYGLAMHGSGPDRVRAGLHYVAVNLVGSSLLLVGISMIYGVTGTLNMADLAQRIPALVGDDRAIANSAAAILGVAFLVKAGAWPLCFWLPTTYAAASAPVAAVFAIMTKVGVYAIIRLGFLNFGGDISPGMGFGAGWLLVVGLVTIAFGMTGALASQTMTRLAGYCAIVSSGTMLAVVGTGNEAALGGALFYLIGSTLGVSALFLLIELIERERDPASDDFLATMETWGDEDEMEPGEEEIGIAIPGMLAILGVAFVACALVLAGMPPFPGFVGKVAILAALLGAGDPAATNAPVPGSTWAVMVLLIVSGLALLIALTRAGINAIWTHVDEEAPRVSAIEFSAVSFLLLTCFGLTLGAGPVMRYTEETARALHTPSTYIEDVLAPGTAFDSDRGER